MLSRQRVLLFVLLTSCFPFIATLLSAEEVWDVPAFSADPESLRRAAAEIKPGKDADATILLNEHLASLDATGKILKKHHMIYRIETKDGIEIWAKIRGEWSPWYQSRPEIRARVISPDGTVHTLDLKTLADIPVRESSSDIYTDRRAYGGPLPALAIGSIVEEEVTTRDTTPFFSGGSIERYGFAWDVPVTKTRFVLSHPDSLPVHYVLHQLSDAKVSKETSEGNERIVVEKGPIEGYSDELTHTPPEVVLYPTIEFSTAISWQQVATEYARQVEEKLRTSDVQALITKLQLANASGVDRIGRIVSALHKNVRYTGVEFGESGLIPQTPGEVLKRKYGDCKDKATLLIAMLRAAGIPAHLALLSAGPGEDIDPELPGMGRFDHAIVYVPGADPVPELWIDATDEDARVGDLPAVDYGRWALIADEKTTALTKTPELTSEKNRHVETREFTLANFGPAQILEKDEQFGPTEGEYRDYYGGEAKKVREDSEKYVKEEYLADSITSLEKTDPADLAQPFVVTYRAKGRRGFTEIENATVYIRQSGIFDGLPDYFYREEKKEKTESQEDQPQPRTVDWMIRPFLTEWRYKIVAPDGFKVRALPADKDEQLGTAHFSQKYTSSQGGSVVEATLRFDTGKARLTVEEARRLRDAVVKVRSADGTSINFDQAGYSLLSAGKTKDALATDRQLVSAHPKDALQRVRLAKVLLAAGLGEKARAMIREATVIDPGSARAFNEQGWILEHDLIGRRFGKGFDHAGAVAAFRKAKQLDEKDRAVRANLAILMEYDQDGTRYSKQADLEGAITEFKELKKLDEDYAKSYETYIPYDLWYLGKFKELSDYVASLPASDTQKAFTLAAIAATNGPEAAMKRSLEITSEEQDRSKALLTAGRLALRIRNYPVAAELLSSAAQGQANESQMTPFLTVLKKTKPYQELKIDDSKPESVLQRVLGVMLTGEMDLEKLKALLSEKILHSSGRSDLQDTEKLLQVTMFQLRSMAEKSGLTLQTLADVALSAARFSVEGDDGLGYKITVQTPGAAAQDAFVVRENGQYKMVEFSEGSSRVPEDIAWEVLARLEKNDLAGARKWLDWARERVHINSGDDPLSGQPFPHFWTKGQQGDGAAIRTAALILLRSSQLKDQNLGAFINARNIAKTDADRAQLNLVLAYAYLSQQRWAELRDVSLELLKAYPDSLTAYRFVASAYAQLKQFDEWEKLLQVRLEKYPDEEDYVISAAELARYQGQFDKSRTLLKVLIDRGKASASGLNSYAWDALYIGRPVDQDAIDAAQRANDLTKNANFSIQHTLACLDAAIGKTKEARELLLKAMNEANLEEPDSAIWLGLGMIAEQYGEPEAALAMYARVEKRNPDSPASDYVLAQQHLVGLRSAGVSAKAGQ